MIIKINEEIVVQMTEGTLDIVETSNKASTVNDPNVQIIEAASAVIGILSTISQYIPKAKLTSLHLAHANLVSTTSSITASVSQNKAIEASQIIDMAAALVTYASAAIRVAGVISPQIRLLALGLDLAGLLLQHGDKLFSNENMRDIDAMLRDLDRVGDELLDKFLEDLGADFDGIQGEVSDFFTAAQNWITRRDPLTFDLDGDGLETIAIDPNNPILFDHDADGVKTGTGWISPDDGFLVLDRNGNGTIDSGRELFGDSTLHVGMMADDGFHALSMLDSHKDSVIDEKDAYFSQLRIWRDLNSDGLSQTGELLTLSEVNIASINVRKTENNTVLDNGNVIADLGNYTRIDGTLGTMGITGQLGDVDLAENTFYSHFIEAVPVSVQAAALPNVHGSGMVRELREAITLDQSGQLLAQVTEFANATTRAEQMAVLDQLIKAWADTSTQEPSFGYHVGEAGRIGGIIQYDFEDLTFEQDVARARGLLTIVERFNGRWFFDPNTRLEDPTFASAGGGSSGGGGTSAIAGPPLYLVNISSEQNILLDKSYWSLKEYVYESLVLQTRLKPFVDAISVKISGGQLNLDFSQVENLLTKRVTSDLTNGVIDMVEFVKYIGTNVVNTGWDALNFLVTSLETIPISESLRLMLLELGVQIDGIDSAKLNGSFHRDIIIAGDGNDSLVGFNGNDLLAGENGDDRLYGDIGNDILNGGAGNDGLYGGVGDDVLDGGAGNDYLLGDTGNDVYLFGRGSGQDTIYHYDTMAGRIKTIRVGAGVAPADIKLTNENHYLVLTIKGTTDRIQVTNFFNNYTNTPHRIDQIEFADGTLWDLATIKAKLWEGTEEADTLSGLDGGETLNGYGGDDRLHGDIGNDILNGGAGNDGLYGGAGDDVLDGGAGNDYLLGDTGNDVYLFGRGSGQDTIYHYDTMAGRIKTIRVGAGVAPADIKLTNENHYLVLTIKGTTDRIQVTNFFNNYTNTPHRIDQIEFADGTMWDLATIKAKLWEGTEEADTLYGLDGGETLNGYGGHDQLYGDIGNDILNGGAGNDGLYAQTGNDTLNGGIGNDYLQGGIGDDLYTFQLGSGADVIYEERGVDVLHFDTSISSEDIFVKKNGNNLVLKHINNVDQVVVTNWYSSADLVVEQVEFADGARWSVEELALRASAIYGSNSDDVLTGSTSSEVFFVYGGNDAITGGAGNDFIDAGTGNDIAWGNDGNDFIRGAAGDDGVYGDAGNDQLDGGAGNDILNGGTGNDVYVFQAGDGVDQISDGQGYDIVRFNGSLTPENIRVIREGENIVFSQLNGTDNVVLANWYQGWYGSGDITIEQVEFADGTVWSTQEIDRLAKIIHGTTNHDILSGYNTDETFLGYAGDDQAYGHAGDDQFDSGTGNDTLYGGTGDDSYVFRAGDGADWIAEAQGFDTVRFDASVLPSDIQVKREGDNLVLKNINGNDSVVLSNWYANMDLAVEQVEFADGTVWPKEELERLARIIHGTNNDEMLAGYNTDETFFGYAGNDGIFTADGNDIVLAGEGDDWVEGNHGDDQITGGTGNDILVGMADNDSYLFGFGDGTDRILDDQGFDSVRFDASVNPESIRVIREGDNLILKQLNGSDSIVLANWYQGWYGSGDVAIEQVEFADGTIWSKEELDRLARIIHGTTNDDMLFGYETNETFYGYAGNDFIGAAAGHDVVYAAEGDDIIGGNEGDDQIDGGSGNDNLHGDAGNDQLTGGDGNDYIDGGDGHDVLFGEADNDSLFGNTGNDVIDAGEGDDVVAGNDGDDQISGGGGNDILLGDDGADYIAGGTGSDYLDGGAGTDTLAGGEGDDVYVYELGDVISEEQNQGLDTVQSAISYALLSNFENLTLTGFDSIDGTGNELNNVIFGNNAANVLDGAIGSDFMAGNAGDDVYKVDATDDIVSENVEEGIDTVFTSATYTLQPNIENLILNGASAINGTGNELNNMITGNIAANVLNGGLGADLLLGGMGDDVYVIDDSGDVIVEQSGEGTDTVNSTLTYTLDPNFENLTLIGEASINGTGNAANNILIGNSGANILDGAAGVNTLIGGQGDDTYIINNLAEQLIENAAEGTDTVISAMSYTLGNNLENLTLTGNDIINGSGNNLDNVLVGNGRANFLQGEDGDDVLDGGAGPDRLEGGRGNDIYIVEDRGETVSENANEGIDTVQSTVSYTLRNNVEILRLMGTSTLNGNGNNLNNFLIGNAGDNNLNGKQGNDILQGGLGNDMLNDSSGNNVLNGQAGVDSLTGAAGNELFIGGAGNDTLTTGTGHDIIAFNRGDGLDIIAASSGTDNTISLGGGINYSELALQRAANDLILEVGAGEQLTLKDWYASPANKSVVTLQMIAEAMNDYDVTASDPLRNNKVEQFNFAGLVDQFDQTVAANAGVTRWSLTDALLAFHNGESDSAAIGGDLVYQYGRQGTLSTVGLTAAQGLLGNAQFGSTNQTLLSTIELNNGVVKLA